MTLLFLFSVAWNILILINANGHCNLPAETGPCKARFDRWYYNTADKECRTFIYGGCRGNANNFMSKEDCESECGPICKRPAKTGPCRAAFKRWFYNHNDKECQLFTYGGCQSNGNNFKTKAECEEKCDTCNLPIVSGPCEAYMPRWAFNSQSGQCEQFIYGGCQGNANNFDTEQECFNACDRSGCDYVDCSNTHCPAGIKKVKGCRSRKCQCNCPCKTKKCTNSGQQCVLRQDPDCKGKSCPMVAECDYKLCDIGELMMYPDCSYTKMECPNGFTCKWSPVDWPHGCCPNDVCHANPNSGCGKGQKTRWYYDYKKGDCFTFRYGGKGRSGNNFKSKKKCMKACS